MQRIGIMQGRLVPPEAGRFQSFPREGWRTEFGSAAAAGLDSIEWIYDEWGEDVNPISSDEGILSIRNLADQNGVAVVSVCADYFMERPLVRVSSAQRHSSMDRLLWLIARCRQLGAERIVMPFVDNSAIRSEQEMGEVATMLCEIMPAADQARVEIHLEASLPPDRFAALLDQIQFPALKVNYDTGNSASLGYDYREEIAAYGDRIGSVHIKDRVRGGGTVPLGRGDARIPEFLAALRELKYPGDFILQVARGEPGQEVEWTKTNLRILAEWQGLAATQGSPR
jgi:L-ribulose-5-phosphate 3-epimerase